MPHDFPRRLPFFIAYSRYPPVCHSSPIFLQIYDKLPHPFFLFRCNYWHCTACIRPTTLEVYCFHMDNNTATPIFVSWCARDLERTHSGHTSSSSVTERWRKKWRVLRERNTGGKNNSHFLQKVLKDRGMHFVKSAPLIFPSSTAVTRCEEVTE